MSLTLNDLATLMKDVDTCILATRGEAGFDARPMSNNRSVEWDGTTWFFALEHTNAVRQIQADATALVSYAADTAWVAVSGTATLHTDKALMQEHWDPDIERWFKDGVDTPGLNLIEITPTRIRYWTFEHGDGEIDL